MSESTASNPEHGSIPAGRRSPGLPSSEKDLVTRVSALIDTARDSIASYANATLTMTYWQIGSIIDSEVLGEQRAEYGAQTLVTLSHELTARYGKGFDRPNLSRMVNFARCFPDRENVVTLSHTARACRRIMNVQND